MTEDELTKKAIEYRVKLVPYTELGDPDVEIPVYTALQIGEAYIEGAKENGVIWHDLRKNPDDLPKKVGNYLVCYLDTMLERHTFELSYVDYLGKEHWIDENNHNIETYDEGVIAWCEIPKFEE